MVGGNKLARAVTRIAIPFDQFITCLSAGNELLSVTKIHVFTCVKYH